jgi:hypothetical protein
VARRGATGGRDPGPRLAQQDSLENRDEPNKRAVPRGPERKFVVGAGAKVLDGARTRVGLTTLRPGRAEPQCDVLGCRAGVVGTRSFAPDAELPRGMSGGRIEGSEEVTGDGDRRSVER